MTRHLEQNSVEPLFVLRHVESKKRTDPLDEDAILKYYYQGKLLGSWTVKNRDTGTEWSLKTFVATVEKERAEANPTQPVPVSPQPVDIAVNDVSASSSKDAAAKTSPAKKNTKPERPATQKQIEYAESLGIVVPPNISIREMSNLIDATLEQQREAKYKAIDDLENKEWELVARAKAEMRDEGDPPVSEATVEQMLETLETRDLAAIIITFPSDAVGMFCDPDCDRAEFNPDEAIKTQSRLAFNSFVQVEDISTLLDTVCFDGAKIEFQPQPWKTNSGTGSSIRKQRGRKRRIEALMHEKPDHWDRLMFCELLEAEVEINNSIEFTGPIHDYSLNELPAFFKSQWDHIGGMTSGWKDLLEVLKSPPSGVIAKLPKMVQAVSIVHRGGLVWKDSLIKTVNHPFLSPIRERTLNVADELLDMMERFSDHVRAAVDLNKSPFLEGIFTPSSSLFTDIEQAFGRFEAIQHQLVAIQENALESLEAEVAAATQANQGTAQAGRPASGEVLPDGSVEFYMIGGNGERHDIIRAIPSRNSEPGIYVLTYRFIDHPSIPERTLGMSFFSSFTPIDDPDGSGIPVEAMRFLVEWLARWESDEP